MVARDLSALEGRDVERWARGAKARSEHTADDYAEATPEEVAAWRVRLRRTAEDRRRQWAVRCCVLDVEVECPVTETMTPAAWVAAWRTLPRLSIADTLREAAMLKEWRREGW